MIDQTAYVNKSTFRTKESLRLEAFIRSDSLPAMLEVARNLPALAPVCRDLVQIRIILDANIVQGELRWRLRRRRDPMARSALHEAIASGVVLAFAPPFLDSEIAEHEQRIATDTGSSVADVQREWQDFRKLLHFYCPTSRLLTTSDVADPDDLHYFAACSELGAMAVYSRDRHFQEMNTPVICVAIDTTLRSYARATSIHLGVTMGSTFCITVSFEAISAACRLAKQGLQWFRRLHPAVQLAIVGAVIAALAHPKSRAKLTSAWQALKRFAGPTLLAAVVDVATQFVEAMKLADEARKDIQRILPLQPKRSALIHARAICSMAKAPLSLAEIERRMRTDGYVSRSRTFKTYLRRVLRSSGQFVEIDPGFWAMPTAKP